MLKLIVDLLRDKEAIARSTPIGRKKVSKLR